MEVKWSVSPAWADAGESAYVRVLTRRGGCKHNFSKDRRVRQRWRRSERARRSSRRSRRGSRGPEREGVKEVAVESSSLKGKSHRNRSH